MGHPLWLGDGEAAISFDTSLAVASWKADAVDIFMRGGDRTLLQRGATTAGAGGGIGFTSLAAEVARRDLTSGPAAVASHSGTRIDVVARGTDNAFWHTAPASRAP